MKLIWWFYWPVTGSVSTYNQSGSTSLLLSVCKLKFGCKCYTTVLPTLPWWRGWCRVSPKLPPTAPSTRSCRSRLWTVWCSPSTISNQSIIYFYTFLLPYFTYIFLHFLFCFSFMEEYNQGALKSSTPIHSWLPLCQWCWEK